MAIKIRHFKTRVVRYPALGASIAAALLATGFVFDLNKSEWAYWVGSIGTVGTLVGTIWLATGETRRQRRDNLLRARLHGSAITFKLLEIRSVLQLAKRDLGLATNSPNNSNELNQCALRLAGIRPWAVDDLIPMVPLPGNVAAGLVSVGALITNFPLQIADEIGEAKTDEERVQVAMRLLHMLSTIDRTIKEISIVCHEAGQYLLRHKG